MKALVLTANQKIELMDVPSPQPAPDECLIAVRRAGICNSDISRAYENGAYSYPLIMGHEFAGVVEEVGSNVKNIKPGDRVAVFPLIPCSKCEHCQAENYAQCVDYDYYGSRRDGAFAELIAVKEWNVFPLPSQVSLDDAAMLEPISVAFHSLKKLRVAENDSVLIFGAGVIGLVMARYILSDVIQHGRVFVVDHNDFKLAKAAGYGAETINPKHDNNWLPALLEATGGGVNQTIEACGATKTFEQSLQITKSHGQVLWVGNIQRDLKLSKKIISSILRKELTIQGCWNSSYTRKHEDDWHTALRFIKKTGLTELISHSVSLDEGADIFNRLYANRTRKNADDKEPFLKVMFNIQADNGR